MSGQVDSVWGGVLRGVAWLGGLAGVLHRLTLSTLLRNESSALADVNHGPEAFKIVLVNLPAALQYEVSPRGGIL